MWRETSYAPHSERNTNAVRELQTLINEKTGRPLSKKEIRDMAKKQKKADKDAKKGKK